MAKIIVSDASGEREVPLDKDELGIGRTAQNDISLKVPEASREHCRILREGDAWFVEDLQSSNGTRVNGRKVTKFELQDGDEISIGAATMRFLESEVVDDLGEISLEEPDEVELEITLDEDAWLRFGNTDREGEKVELTGRITIGRKSTNSISLKEHGVSGTHAEVISRGGEWVLRDLGSTNGIVVDGEKVDEAVLEAGSQIRIGSVHFIAAIGGSEGDGSLVETLMVEEMPLDDEVFAISEKNFQRRQKAAFLGWLVVFGLGLAAAGYWFMQGSSQQSGTAKPIRIAGNLITEGASFELKEDREDYLVTESPALEFEESDRRAHSGTHALEIRAKGGDGRQDILFEETLGAIGNSDLLTISAYMRSSGLDGRGGLSLIWLDDRQRPIRHSRLNVAEGSSSFEKLEGTFRVPNGMRGAQFAISVSNATGKLVVDDVAVVKVRREERSTLMNQGFELVVEPNGRLTLLRDAIEILADGELRIQSGDKWLSRQDDFACEDCRVENGSARLKGLLEGAEVSISADARDGGFSCEFKTSAPTEDQSVVLSVPAGDDVVTVGEDGTRRHVDPFERAGVMAVVVGSGVRAVEIQFEAPQKVSFARIEGESRLLLPLQDGACRFNLKVDFSDANEAAQAAMKAAERADIVEKKYGEAIGLYQGVVDRFPFRKDLVQRAERRLSDLRRSGEAEADALEARLRDIVFFRRFSYDGADFQAEANSLASRYAGSAIAERAQSLSGELAKAMMESESADHERLARNHLERGRDLLKPGQSMPVLARGFFRSVLDLAPDSEWAEAARTELEKISTLVGGKEGN